MARNAAAAVARQVMRLRHLVTVSSSASVYAYPRLLSFGTTESQASQFSYLLRHHQQQRFLSSDTDTDTVTAETARIASIYSLQDLKSAFQKVQDESLPALFYFTAAWCSPCKFIALTIDEMRTLYPHVNFYKIDIDQPEIRGELEALRIAAVPTMVLYEKGKMVEEIVGADRGRLKTTMEKYYKPSSPTDSAY